MATIDHLIRNSEKLDFNQVIAESIEATTKEFIETQQDQLLHGFNAKGERFAPYKSAEYAEQKHQLNPLPGLGNPDLRLTGSLHENIVLGILKSGSVTIESIDSKYKALNQKYEFMLGLNDSYVPVYLRYMRPVAIDTIKHQILQ